MKHFTDTFSIGFYCRPSRISSNGGCPVQTQHRYTMNTTIIATTNALAARHISSITRTTGSALMGASKALLIEEAKRQMRTTSGCHFIYEKADGSIREAFGTLNAAICGKHINGRGDSPETWGCTCYWYMEKGGFRSFRWANLIAVL